MATKKSVSSKKSSAKKITRPKKPAPRKAQKTQKAKAKAKKATSAKKATALTDNITKELQQVMGGGAHQQNIPLLPAQLMEDTIEAIQNLMADFVDVTNNNLTAAQRRRKIGPGVRNYGFIDKVSDLAEANPQYVQFFKLTDLKNCIRNIEALRDLALLLQSFARAVTNTMLIYSTDASLMARDYYHTVQRQAQRGDPTAIELERTLRTFFRRARSAMSEPTIMQTERDAHAILTHKKEGRIVIEGRGPRVTGGVTKVIDDVRKGKDMMKGSIEEQEEN